MSGAENSNVHQRKLEQKHKDLDLKNAVVISPTNANPGDSVSHTTEGVKVSSF